ncbi:MAG: hypothetical protein ACR2OU_17660 [Thermomicrobiales bacterium]
MKLLVKDWCSGRQMRHESTSLADDIDIGMLKSGESGSGFFPGTMLPEGE